MAVTKRTRQNAPVAVGAMVKYHGSIEAAHGTYRVDSIDAEGRYRLVDRYYPDVRPLSQVRRASITPTGEVLALCHCGHEVADAHADAPDWCSRCDCSTHRKES